MTRSFDWGFDTIYYFFVTRSMQIAQGAYDIHTGFAIHFDGIYTRRKQVSYLTTLQKITIVLQSSFEGNTELAIHCHKMN